MYRRSVLTELDAPEVMMETGLIKEDAYSDSWTVSNYGKIMDSWHRGM